MTQLAHQPENIIQCSTMTKTILFFPLNSPGHINSSLGIADRLRQDGYRTVFLLLGSMIGDSIREHGHELITLVEEKEHEDYEISEDEDLSKPVDEALQQSKGKSKKKFPGVFKWPQLIHRNQRLMRQSPLEAFVNSAEIMEEAMVGELVENHDNYARAIDSVQPDLIIIDAYYIPPCIVKRRDIPWIRLYSANPLMLAESKLPDGIKPPPMIGFSLYNKQERSRLRQQEPEKWSRMLADWRAAIECVIEAMDKAGGRLQAFMQQHGVPPLPPGKQAHDSPFLNIYMYPRVLDYEQDDDMFSYPLRWVRCDSLMRQPPRGSAYEAEVAKWKAKIDRAAQGKSAIVFFSLGSLASGDVSLMKRYVRMLAQDQSRLYLVSKGVSGDKFELDEGNMVGANYVPQAYFLERAQLAIIHGGNNSITECMYYGRPMVVIPVFADQLDNAQRVEDLGFGRRLHLTESTQSELQATVCQLLGDHNLIARLKGVSEQMRTTDDVGKVLTAIEKLIEDGQLEDEFIRKNLK